MTCIPGSMPWEAESWVCSVYRHHAEIEQQAEEVVWVVDSLGREVLVACHHAGGKRLLFAVQLDLVLPQRLVQAPGGQGGVLLGQIIVQPGGGKTLYF